MLRSRSLTHAAWITAILASNLIGAEPALPQADSSSVIAPQDLYDTETPSDLDRCNISVWNTHAPQIQFTADLLVMDRSSSGGTPLLIDSQTGQVLLNTGSIIQDAEPGIRLGMIFLDEGGYDVEFGFLSLDTFNQSATRTSNNPIVFGFFGGVPANPQSSYTANYRSQFNSGEINIRKKLGSQASWLAGFRYIELREAFDISSGSGGFFSGTDNDLFGFQLGGDVQLFRVCRSLVFSTVKAGVYYNSASVTASADSGRGPIGFLDGEDLTAFAGDVALGMLIPMGPSADLRIGYQGLFLDGVALAPEQSDNYSLFNSSGSIDDSSVYYHGGFLGFDLFW